MMVTSNRKQKCPKLWFWSSLLSSEKFDSKYNLLCLRAKYHVTLCEITQVFLGDFVQKTFLPFSCLQWVLFTEYAVCREKMQFREIILYIQMMQKYYLNICVSNIYPFLFSIKWDVFARFFYSSINDQTVVADSEDRSELSFHLVPHALPVKLKK